MNKKDIKTILEETLFVNYGWERPKFADWKWIYHAFIEGIDDAADAIIKKNLQHTESLNKGNKPNDSKSGNWTP